MIRCSVAGLFSTMGNVWVLTLDPVIGNVIMAFCEGWKSHKKEELLNKARFNYEMFTHKL